MSTKTRTGTRRRSRRPQAVDSTPPAETTALSAAPAPAPPETGVAAPAAEATALNESSAIPTPAAEPRNHRELAEAILTRCDPVQIGCELLASSSEKGASVRARVFETLVNWQFGKTGEASSTDRPNLRIIWDLPGPPHESEDAA